MIRSIIIAGSLTFIIVTPVRASDPPMARTDIPSLEQLTKKCKIGSSKPAQAVPAESYAGSGFTPAAVTGAITVSAEEAKCVIDRYADAIVVADAAGEGTLPETVNIAFAGRPPAEDKVQGDLVRILDNASGGNRASPILVYCHNIACGMSYYAAQRMVLAGYSTVLWMRDGSVVWKQLGYPDAGGVSRFRSKPNERAWETCVYDATASATGSDKDSILQGVLSACRSIEPDPAVDERFYPAGTTTKFVAGTKFRAAERIAKEVEWKSLQGIGAPESELVAGYEYCFANQYEYYTRVFPSRVGKAALQLSNFYSRYANDAENGRQFAEKVRQIQGSTTARRGGCKWFPTASEAEAAFTADIAQWRGQREIVDWRPSR